MEKQALIALFIVYMLALGISAAEGDEPKTILETVASDGNLNTLLSAIEAAGLVGDLSGEGPFTLFAPTDGAFDEAKEIDDMDKKTLTEILKYHIASGILVKEDLANMTSLPTLQGENITIEVNKEVIKVDDANVTTENLICRNGVIHIIDAVLMPASLKRLQDMPLPEDDFLEERLDKERMEKLMENVPPSQMS